jgi:N utilization substance protein A
VVPGAPVSVLIDYGLGENLAEKLVEAGISTVEKLGNMTPEQLEEIPGIGEPLVEKIQLAVNNYYGQFETGENAQPGAAEAGTESGVALEEPNPDEPAAASEAVEAQETAEIPAETLEAEPNIEPIAGESDTIKDPRQGAEGRRPEEPTEEGKEG